LIEWNSSLYVSFVDYEKAFDILDRETLWKLMRHYGIPLKLVNLNGNQYTNMKPKVVHGGKQKTEVKTGDRQGCLLSPFLFLLALDWIMKTVTDTDGNGIQVPRDIPGSKIIFKPRFYFQDLGIMQVY
jgi:hypothetical protein